MEITARIRSLVLFSLAVFFIVKYVFPTVGVVVHFLIAIFQHITGMVTP
jgi:hypothetical protein